MVVVYSQGMEVTMRERNVGIRMLLLGLVAVVLGTAAAVGVSEGKGRSEPTVAVAAEVSAPTSEPRRLKLPEEMTEAERERWDRVLELRREGGTLTGDSIWWGDQIPYGGTVLISV